MVFGIHDPVAREQPRSRSFAVFVVRGLPVAHESSRNDPRLPRLDKDMRSRDKKDAGLHGR